jgi:hypothetical protein
MLTHPTAQKVNMTIDWWLQFVSADQLFVVHTGRSNEFADIKHSRKLHMSDDRLTTRDHQRELQSYTRVFRTVAESTTHGSHGYIHFCEYDQIPLIPDLNKYQINKARDERADLLGFQVRRVDDTNDASWLYHDRNPQFRRFWQNTTVRNQPQVVLSMFGSGSFWTREAFEAVAGIDEPFPMYLEIYLPTLAHHLGFRVRDFGEQNRFVQSLGDLSDGIESARSQGAWTLHPVKELPSPAHPR